MQRIINFIFRNKNFLSFLLLFSLALMFTVQSHSYHKSKFVNSANFLAGSIYTSVDNIDQYFSLKKVNEQLVKENLLLKKMLLNTTDSSENSIVIDSTSFEKQYRLIGAKIIRNDYSKKDNFLLLKKGEADSIKPDMGVFTRKGIVGIINNTSNNYSTVISILNSRSKINAEVKRTKNYGTLLWNGNSPYVVQLNDVPKRAPIAIGDSIITGGRSTIFPKGIPIGTIKDFGFDSSEDYYEIEVELFNNMTNLEYVYIIENVDKDEIKTLEQTILNE